ncbi:licodione synthase-like [Corylus avellana]|uniref:licodione synthase-like n=1 Tax=Corylus avellana TaxID=13451 RepID=UPI00286CE656|nr:licodione synthase-like [Corylus avellana]
MAVVLELLVILTLLLALLALSTILFSTIFQSKLPPSPIALPIIGHFHLLGPLIHHSFHHLSLRHGPLFSLRLGSVPCIVASTPEYAKEILKNNEHSFTSRKHTIAIARLTYNSSFAFAPYGPFWKFIKKLSTNELLGTRTLNTFLSLREKEYRRLLRYLADRSEAGEAVNITEELLRLTNNIISQMMLGRAEEARAVVRDVTKIFGEFNVSDYIWFCKHLDLQGFGKRIEDIHRRFDALVEKVITEREELRKKKEDGERERDEVKDFIDILLDFSEDENSEIKLTRAHIKALIVDFFAAGTDTTAIATEWALAELINHPMVLEKARKEIDNVVRNSRLVKESDVPNLPYIQAIIKETLRLHPPVPMVTRECIQDCKIGNYVIPADTLLFVNVWAIGRDPNYWKNPLDFEPERFLQSSDQKGNMGHIDIRGQHFQLLPFGSGRRICPGINFAMQELPTLLAAMIQCFDFKLVGPRGETMDGESVVVNMDERPGLTAPRAHDLMCVPIARMTPLDIIDD